MDGHIWLKAQGKLKKARALDVPPANISAQPCCPDLSCKFYHFYWLRNLEVEDFYCVIKTNTRPLWILHTLCVMQAIT